MTEDDIKKNWNYFKSLAKQFHQTEEFVDHAVDSTGKLLNGKTFSNEFAKLLTHDLETLRESVNNDDITISNWTSVAKRRLEPGMSEDETWLILGKPLDEQEAGNEKQLMYNNTRYVFLQDGIVKSVIN